MNNKKTIYIAGPMSNIEEFNFPMFDLAEADLRAKGWNVINPAQMDRDIGFDPLIDTVDAAFLHDAMLRDVDAIANRADALAVLPGWEDSTGAKAEVGLARWKHIPVYAWPDMTEIKTEKPVEKESHDSKEYPVASGVLDYFPDAIREVARCSWVGSQQHNPGAPMNWDRTKSKDHSNSLMRHFLQRGKVDDDGILHVVKTAWRALALAQAEIEANQPVIISAQNAATVTSFDKKVTVSAASK